METRTTARRRAALGVLCAGLFLIGVDVTVMNVALPALQADLRPGMTAVQWVADSYTLALACGVLAGGRWGDRHGRRRAFVVGMGLCGAASVAGALAETTPVVVAARLVMGAGAALLMPSTLSLITVVFPHPAARRKAIAVWALVAGSGAVAGPVLGGVLIEAFTWRAGFWLNVPVAVAAIVAALCWVPESRSSASTPSNRTGPAGATVGLAPLVWAIIEGPARGWTDRWVAGAFVLAAAVLTAVAWRERHHPSPLLPQGLLRERRFTGAAVALSLMFFALFGSLYLISLYLQNVLGYSPSQSGWRMLPLAAALGAGAALSLPVARRWGDRLPVTLGLLLVAAGFIVLTGATEAAGYGPVLCFQLIVGLGTGLAAAPATEAVMAAVPAAHAGTGAALNDLTREVGGALGIAVLGSALTATYQTHLTDHRAREPGPHGTHPAALVPAPDGRVPGAVALEVSRDAFTAGLHTAALIAAVTVLGAAAVAALVLPVHAPREEPDSTAHEPSPHPPLPAQKKGQPR